MPIIAHLSPVLKVRMGAGDADPPHFQVAGTDGTAFTVRLDTLQVLRGEADRAAFGLAVAWALGIGDGLARTWTDLHERD